MKILTKYALCAFFCVFLLLSIVSFAVAEDLPAGTTIPKLPTTANDPVLSNGKVYPFWGPVCQRYTYSVVYSDKDGRPPEYVKIYFNGKMLDMEKEDPSANDYKKGVKYIYKNVPDKFGSNFYYFEASNGLGKTRDSIIDSPDNGPVLFDSDFKNNEIALIDPAAGKEVWRYSTGEEWVGAVALSDDGNNLAAQTSNHIYYFDTAKNEPLWSYKSEAGGAIGGDVKGGVALSSDGSKIFAALNGKALMFTKDSNKPIWTYNLEENGGGAYGVDVSKDGQYAAVAMAGEESDQNSNVLILFDASGKKLWQYHSSGNWHEVSFSSDGKYLAGATGCPDRRGYLFSKDSAEPIIKSEPLSKESPIDEARISADGNLVAFGVESSYGAVVLMDKSTKEILWQYDTPQSKSVRALAITPSGEFIGAGTFGGDVLIFNKNSKDPVEKVNINSAIGAFDLAFDGSFYASGSADKKVRLFEKGAGKVKAEITLNEYVGELDIAENGKYVVAGTSGSVYFFETLIDLNQTETFACDKVIEPPAEEESLSGGQKTNNKQTSSLTWPLISVLGAGLLMIALTLYLYICRQRKILSKKIVVIGLILLIIILAVLGLYLWRFRTSDNSQNFQSPTTSDTGEKKSDCGNNLCEPDGGETKENCAKDCSDG